MSFLTDLLDPENLTPHGFCLAWDPGLMGLHVVSDALIGIAYYSIPVCLAVFLARRDDLAFKWVFALFAVFIVACGTTHFLAIWTLWFPDYVLDGAVKAITALISVATAIALWPLLPRALALPSPAALRRANERLQREIDERERTEAMLRQAQKMEAIGKLTGGIAHDFNNLLTSMTTNIELLDRKLGDLPAPDLRRYTGRALNAAKRGGALTQQLLTFARRQTLATEAVDVARFLGDMLELLRGTVGADIGILLRARPGLWTADADPGQLGSAILNLVINARDAMPQGGLLTIAVENRVLTAADLADAALAEPGEYVRIMIADTGTGMSPDVAAQAFDPFFTTKPVGKGTGLGLSQVYGFVMQLHGHLTLETTQGRGTTVTMYLRRAMPRREAVADAQRGETA